LTPRPARSTLFPYTTLFRSKGRVPAHRSICTGRNRKVHRLHRHSEGRRIRKCAGRKPIETRAWPHRRRTDLHAREKCRHVLYQVDRKSTRLNSSHVKISYAV